MELELVNNIILNSYQFVHQYAIKDGEQIDGGFTLIINQKNKTILLLGFHNEKPESRWQILKRLFNNAQKNDPSNYVWVFRRILDMYPKMVYITFFRATGKHQGMQKWQRSENNKKGWIQIK